jgi:hypothetical protein
MGKSLYAGWSVKNITPYGREVSLRGQYYERLTTEVDCDLKAAALAMDNGDESLTWVSCDLVSVSDILCEDVRAAVKERAPTINSANIFLSAIHTHTAPHFKSAVLPGESFRYKPVDGVMTVEEYHDFLVEKIADAIIDANINKLPNCTIQTGVSPVATGCCRRGIVESGEAVMYIDTSRDDFVKMEYPDGGPMNFMYIKDEKGNLKGIVTSIPCTAQVLEHQFYISSDYSGRVRQKLKDKYGDDLFYLPLISAAGDLSPRNLVTKDYGFGNMYEKDGADNMAQRVFDAVTAEENRPVDIISDFSDLQAGVKRIKLPGWIPTEDEYKWALALKDTDEIKFDINDYVQKGVEPYFHTPLSLAKRMEAILARYEHKDAYKEIETEICAVRIGDTVWVSNPFELFQEHASKMIAGSKARSLWSIQLTYDAIGYFPTKEAAAAGGYSGFILSSRVDPFNAGDILVKESIDLADSLF